MRGSEASGPGALLGAASTLTTSVIRNPTSIPTSSAPIPSTDAGLVAKNVEHVLMSLTAQNDGGLVSVSGNSSGSTGKGILIGVLSAFGSAVVAVIVLAIFFFFKYTRRGRIMLDRIGRPGEFDDEQAFAREEAEALEVMDDLSRSEYMRAKAFVEAYPPESMQTDISLSQFLAIQEKGVSAWEFQPELEIANCFVEGRTEIEFYDSECSVQTNLPVPKQNDVYYWEAKIYDKPENTLVSVGMTTKPYPLFRLPGFHKYSVAYSSTGHRRHNQPFASTPYGPPLSQGDVIGVGYRPRSGTIFFTRNGKKLEDVVHAAKTQNFFPTVGANGPCTVHVNFGQMGFVFIEANVKKWGLAPMTGSLAPPPPYGSEQGSILLESGRESAAQISQRVYQEAGYARTNSTVRIPPSRSPGPVRSPTDISLAQLAHIPSHEDVGEGSSQANTIDGEQTPLLNTNDLDDQVPPPEYSSPDGSRRGSDIAGDLPRQGSPPIPSYDAAVGNHSGDTARSDSEP
ncbi:SSH4 family protein [Aspergillus clavatus NRRL 1]|uniref:Protein ssh4 n=1 Tax=Aspergillus clavatus (strain ATCC 1007 / CBS 513.65 / DSM 816 / NCTC 3887 / NRRL 1 / QM 1276 / 107) TaxID=344612 RepID=SSH4_ASPCL|nr:endosomal SPRY domain protein, putative [Aspergillus clavatus NRRL 1]A1CNW8.1 RecName: Full=Protein ssh4 [Aspergillus clavatus NRRL 1]EAW07339.1 endosomal SPRY domain protein, putative [Aspergillus clavatus NRRL 1]